MAEPARTGGGGADDGGGGADDGGEVSAVEPGSAPLRPATARMCTIPRKRSVTRTRTSRLPGVVRSKDKKTSTAMTSTPTSNKLRYRATKEVTGPADSARPTAVPARPRAVSTIARIRAASVVGPRTPAPIMRRIPASRTLLVPT